MLSAGASALYNYSEFVGGFGGAWPRAHSLEDVARFPGGLYNPEDRRVLRLPSCPSSDRNRLIFQHRRLRKVAIRLSRACGLASSVGFIPVLLGARRIPKKAKKKKAAGCAAVLESFSALES